MTTYFWGPEKSLIVPTPDLAFLMHDDDSGRCQMHQVGVPEAALIQWAGENYADKTKIFIDCGAHMGAYSVLLADGFKEVHSFEAQRRTYFQLCGNIFINEKTNIHPYNRALTDLTGSNQKVTLSIVSEDGGGSTICEPHAPVLNQEKVETITIDHYHFNDIGLIKLDIEGNELKAIQGALCTIKRCNFPPLIFEANNATWFQPEKKKLFEYVRSLGYDIAEIRPFDNMYVAVKSK
jgi:FkbM family methyltransferase